MASRTEVLRHKIAREVFSEVDDGDGIREIPSWEIFEKCLEQHKLIKELEHRLSNCIESKFKVGQIVWVLHKELDGVVKTRIESIDIEFEEYVADITYYDIDGIGFDADDLFATEEEAKAKLEEIQDVTD